VSYQLYSLDADGSRHLEEQTQQGNPFIFISGFGFSLDGFEQHLVPLQPGEKFDFTLSPADAFGEYDEEGVHKLKREIFTIDGRFDGEHIYPGAVITLNDEEEHRFLARVEKVDEDSVTVDTNHPLAGQTLQFTGIVLENRDATNDEIQTMLNHLSHECGGCDDCEGCGGKEQGQHKEKGCCGHCHA
jgi:FKBP-type peptidyl-prolyl cis-trans isomerase SlyD